jgi:hypothetical protein
MHVAMMNCRASARRPEEARMTTIRGMVASALIVVATALPACGDSDESSAPDSAPSTTATPTTAAPTTTAAENTTAAPSTTIADTTTAAPSTTIAPTGEPIADGSGCTPGEGDLPDGRWFGLVTATSADGIEFDLACWFSGAAAIQAAAEDGEESPPPNDYYVRNENPATRSLPVDAAVTVVWYPELGDPTSEATTSFSDWVTQDREPAGIPGIWLEIEGGSVVDIHEQWVP